MIKPNKYRVGDLVKVEGVDEWYEICSIHIYINVDEEDEYVEITYGALSENDGEYLDLDEEEVTEVKGMQKKEPVTTNGKIDALLDQLRSINAVIPFVGETDEIKAEIANIKRQLTALTKVGE